MAGPPGWLDLSFSRRSLFGMLLGVLLSVMFGPLFSDMFVATFIRLAIYSNRLYALCRSGHKRPSERPAGQSRDCDRATCGVRLATR